MLITKNIYYSKMYKLMEITNIDTRIFLQGLELILTL